jgi:uncharacterized protein (DUF1330 family)
VTGNMDVFLKDYAAHVQATVDPFGGRYLEGRDDRDVPATSV